MFAEGSADRRPTVDAVRTKGLCDLRPYRLALDTECDAERISLARSRHLLKDNRQLVGLRFAVEVQPIDHPLLLEVVKLLELSPGDRAVHLERTHVVAVEAEVVFALEGVDRCGCALGPAMVAQHPAQQRALIIVRNDRPA